MAGLLSGFKLRSSYRKCQGICAQLNSIGVNAQLAQKGQPEELFRDAQERSIGLIYVRNQEIAWANVVQGNYRSRSRVDLLFLRTNPHPFYYRIWYGLYDPNLKVTAPTLKLSSKRRRAIGPLGRAVDVTWQNELEPVPLEPMASDESLKRRLIKAAVDVEIMAFPDGYWIISNREAGRPPSKPIWDCYEAVAHGLKVSSKGFDATGY